MNDPTSVLQAQERVLLDGVRVNDPTRLERPTSPDPDLILGRIGVTYLPTSRPKGYIRLFPQDFIVEEIMTDGNLVSLIDEASFQDAEDQRTLWIDLVKATLAGPHAMTDIQRAFHLPDGTVGYSGIKDALAITSQRVSLRGATKEMLDVYENDRMWLRPVRYGSGAVQPGDLKGNRFTLVVRSDSPEPIDVLIEERLRPGFINFFGAQRFGSRLVAHRLGQLLLKNDIDAALRIYFGEPGPFDVPLFRDLRLSLGEAFGDWATMLEIAKNFPFTLRSEILVLEALVLEPTKTRAALMQIKDQVKIWIYAYGSWLINRRLSHLVESGAVVPEEIALPINPNGPLPEYREMMTKDGTLGYLDGLRLYPYVQASTKKIPARITPGDLQYKKIAPGWVLRFSLGKGAYATSCLSHVFRLYEGLPVPEWVLKDEIDSFKEIGDGSLASIRERFASVLTRRDAIKEEGETADSA